ITTYAVANTTPVTISANYGSTLTAGITVNPPVLSAFSISPASMVGGVTSQGTVTLTGAAPGSGLTVSLSSTSPSKASVPTNVTVSAGSLSAQFTITTYPVSSATTVTISATQGSTLTAGVMINLPDGILTGGSTVGAADALKALRFAAHIDAPSANDLAHGDVAPLVNGVPHPDGKINLADVVAILRKAAGLINW
ncbi:MAG TPA: hypothetical protein VK654_14535, partial [Nitrospirota bacterium]|nr:hypothetical protein [Nitrospirota bacterium]